MVGFVRFLGCRCLGTLRRVALGSPLLGVVSFFVKKGAAICRRTWLLPGGFKTVLAADFSFARATGRLAALLKASFTKSNGCSSAPPISPESTSLLKFCAIISRASFLTHFFCGIVLRGFVGAEKYLHSRNEFMTMTPRKEQKKRCQADLVRKACSRARCPCRLALC